MKLRFDKGFWELMQHCFDCHVKFETRMRIDGTRKEFVNKKANENFNALIKDISKEYEEWLDEREDKQFITESGNIEKWSGGQGRTELELIFNNRINEFKEKAKKWED